MPGMPSQDAISAAVERLADGPGDPRPVRRGARPDRHRRPRRGVRRPAGAGAEAPRPRAPRSSAARSVPPRRPSRTSSASTSPTSATCSTTWTSARDDATRSRCAPLVQPRVEAEVAFVLGPRRRHGRGRHHRSRRSAAASRWRCRRSRSSTRGSRTGTSGSPTPSPTTPRAGCTSSGARAGRSTELEPRDVEMSLSINGEVRSSGNGAACLGDPLEALRWLAVQVAPLRRPAAGRPGRAVRGARPVRAVRAGRPGGGVDQRVRPLVNVEIRGVDG